MTTFINYSDVCAKAASDRPNKKIKKFYEQRNFIEAFKLIFGLQSHMTEILLNNWNDAIKSEIKNGKYNNMINDREGYELERITLKELTTIANVGKYAVRTLKMKPHIAMAFTLGIYYATFIFEGTSMYLTIDEIYDIIPIHKRTKNGYKTFLRRFFKDGTNDEVLKILFNN